MEWKEFTAKTVEDALNNAMLDMGATIENLEYEVLEKETNGFLGMFGKPAKIKVALKLTKENSAKKFLNDVFGAMGIKANIEVTYDSENTCIDINVDGDEMGVLIGKRGQTLDSLQYLVSLVVNKNSDNYIKVKLDTENYRARRKETLENLAKNIAFKVKRTRKPVSLEPMNPYERRIIHSALQNDKYVETYSEGEEPYRKVVINIKKTNHEAKYLGKTNRDYSKDFNKDTSKEVANNYSKDTTKVYNKDYKKDFSKSSSTPYSKDFSKSSSTPYNKDLSKSNSTPYNKDLSKNSSTPYNKDFNKSSSSTPYNKDYSRDYRKDYKEYKESKEKIVPAENA